MFTFIKKIFFFISFVLLISSNSNSAESNAEAFVLKLTDEAKIIFNVGGGLEQTISLAELTDVCSQITGNTISISQTAENRPGDIPIYVTDNTKITEFSGWRPEITVPTLLSEVYEWLKQDEAMLKPILS